MNSNKNLNLGDEIKNIVQDALNNKDFDKLNQDVQNVAKSALDEVRTSMRDKRIKQNNINNKNWSNKTQNMGTNKSIYEKDSYPSPKKQDNRNIMKSNNKVPSNINRNDKLYLRQTNFTVPMGQVSGVLLTLFGSLGSVGFGIGIFILTLLGASVGSFFHTIAMILLPFFIASIALLLKGNSNRKRLKRFQKYLSCMRGQTYCSIESLSSLTRLNEKFVAKDLRKMIDIGMFPQGHVDNENTWFMLTNETHSQYLKLQKNIEKKNLEIAEQKVKQIKNQTLASDKNNRLTPEIKRSIDEGREFVLEIKEANLAIPGEEISRKLDRLEEITGKIYDYVETHPEKFIEIKKFTEYFLPTTLKLLDAYRRLDDQSVKGDNISNAKEEIEDTMDTINLSFENLLDDLFQDMAMDISTDISVLETILAQEGLTKKNIGNENKTMEDKDE